MNISIQEIIIEAYQNKLCYQADNIKACIHDQKGLSECSSCECRSQRR
jgi:hypothetical protein